MKPAALIAVIVLLTGCAHKPVTVAVPSPPPAAPTEATVAAKTSTRLPEPGAAVEVPIPAQPLLVETGVASWYGAPYHSRRSSDGKFYDMHAMTAAHRTLPLGTIVKVTNPQNGNSVVVRITDRGPFVKGRIIDLSQAAAKQLGMIQKGTTEVRVEVLETPAPIEAGGRWAVQIGSFENEQAARTLAGHLSRRYQTARVLAFGSPVGDWWVRVRVKGDLRARAEEIIREANVTSAATFLVRLD
ncbi:MAG: septal ring lytic transglycosylase RlpA family protein [Acidobacteria bacterium]|nr:septal ring lytic transglycosylase RlpA family protein [Acidobacteriota bacterium]